MSVAVFFASAPRELLAAAPTYHPSKVPRVKFFELDMTKTLVRSFVPQVAAGSCLYEHAQVRVFATPEAEDPCRYPVNFLRRPDG